MLIVKLAGYNVDTDVLEKLKTSGWDGKNNITPETISAAYARISRDPRPVTELRADAREELDKARKSNENIVFKMGHHSVAEHALLNFDILGLSRLAVEALEESRLSAYTEKSQRYITLQGDYVTPAEFNEQEKAVFQETVAKQVEAYKKLFPILYEYQKKIHADMLSTKGGQNTVEGWAKEDARYVLSMATECQLGFSTNSRNLEYIIRKLKYNPLAESRELGQKFFDSAKTIVPSLIILSDPETFKKQFGFEVSDGLLATGKNTIAKAMKKIPRIPSSKSIKKIQEVKLVYNTEDADTKIIAALISTATGKDYLTCLKTAKKLGKKGQTDFVRTLFADLNEYDSLFREFEMVNFVFEVILSSSAFAQMKRHRMMTILKQQYDPALGVTVPPSITETKQTGVFNKIIDETEKTYKKLKKSQKYAADYILTNSHRRRIIINADLREIYHIARLRMDKHAQWDIQDISGKMVEEVKKVAPITAVLACGKDEFAEEKKKLFE